MATQPDIGAHMAIVAGPHAGRSGTVVLRTPSGRVVVQLDADRYDRQVIVMAADLSPYQEH